MSRYSLCRWTAVLCLGLGLSSLFACGRDSAAPAVQRTDSAGVEIVLSSGADCMLDWRLQRLFALGGADEGPESFFQLAPGLVGADGSGNLFILDRQNSRVVVFDANGQFLRSMGSNGGGPGEFHSPASISVASDGAVAVFDQVRLVRFDGNGAVVEEQQLPFFPTPNRQRHFSQFGNTTFVSSSTNPMEPGDLIQTLRQIVGSDTTVLAELRLPPVRVVTFEQCGVSMPRQPIFVAELAWAAQPGVVTSGSTAEYSISMNDSRRLTRIVRRDIAPMPATREQALAQLGDKSPIEIRRSCFIDPGDIVDKSGYAETIPLIGTVLLSPSGELWVERFSVDRNATAPVDVFDASGAYVGTLVNDSFSPVILLPGGRVGVVETDELDVQRLVVYAIQR